MGECIRLVLIISMLSAIVTPIIYIILYGLFVLTVYVIDKLKNKLK